MPDESTTSMVPVASFQDRLKERIRESIGELLSDDDLSTIVQRGIDEVFFQERRIPAPRYGHVSYEPPLIHEIVKEVLTARMIVAVDSWLRSHEEEVEAAITETVEAGAGAAMLQGMNKFFSDSMTQLQFNIGNNLRQGS